MHVLLLDGQKKLIIVLLDTASNDPLFYTHLTIWLVRWFMSCLRPQYSLYHEDEKENRAL